MSSVHGIMRIYACGSILEEGFIFCQKPGYAVAYRLKGAFIGLDNIYRYHRSLAGGILYCTRAGVQYIKSPRGRQPEAEIFSYSTDGPKGPSAIRFYRPHARG